MGNSVSFRHKHVLITGGSTGIGFALAKSLVREDASVTILARDQNKLDDARANLLREHPDARVGIISADVTDYVALEAKLRAYEEDAFGPFDVAICNAGFAMPGLFVEQPLELAAKQMSVNYFGAHHTAKAVLPGMLARRSGHLCFISSSASLIGLVGYTSYSPSKYAVRGLAECLRSELCGTGVSVSIGYPPDTNTPGYKLETAGKPAALQAVNDFCADTVFEPEVVAGSLLAGLKRGNYHLLNPDILQQLLISLSSGVTPKPLGLLLEMLLAPILVLVAVVIRRLLDRIVQKQNRMALNQEVESRYGKVAAK